MNIAARRLPKLLNIALLASALSLPCAVPLRGQSPPASDASSDKPAAAASQPSISGSSAKPNLPKFTVATIKPAAPSDDNMLMFTPDGVSIHGIPMKMLLRESFGVENDRIFGEPGWVKSRCDIETKIDPDNAPKLKNMKMDQRRATLLPLLQERFNLKYHHESRKLPMHALVVAKGGLKLKASAPEDPPKADDSQKPGDGEAKDKPRMGRRSLVVNGRGLLESTGTTTEMLGNTTTPCNGPRMMLARRREATPVPEKMTSRWMPADRRS